MKRFTPDRDVSLASPEAPAMPVVNPDPTRVLVREVVPPGEQPRIDETSFEDARSIAAARKSRPGGYLRLTLNAAKALGKSVILLDKFMEGTDLILRVRLFPVPVRSR